MSKGYFSGLTHRHITAFQIRLSRKSVSLVGKVLGQPSLIAQVTQYSGPLPPSEELERYNQVVPGLADRLVTTFEKQASHRMELENWLLLLN
jgi:uncharacterized membrane protein